MVRHLNYIITVIHQYNFLSIKTYYFSNSTEDCVKQRWRIMRQTYTKSNLKLRQNLMVSKGEKVMRQICYFLHGHSNRNVIPIPPQNMWPGGDAER